MGHAREPADRPITLNSILSAAITYTLLGISIQAAIIYTGITAVAEFFYHWNVHTPRWLGPIFQRPESHRVHHKRGYHTNNYADLPIFDIMFGTYENPQGSVPTCGFTEDREDRFEDMMAFRNLHDRKVASSSPLHFLPTCIGCRKRWACAKLGYTAMLAENEHPIPASGARRGLRWRNRAALVLGLLGCTQMVGYITGSVVLRGIGAATAASPLPRVFSDVDGLETFASEFTLGYRDADGTIAETLITPQLYGRLRGPYNRRNVYGAALSYAPRLPSPLWESVYCYGFAPQGPLRNELGLGADATDISVTLAAALLLWYGWACLFNRNVLISNPSIAYVGLLLLLTTLVPANEPLRAFAKKATRDDFYVPAAVYWTAWFLMAAGYTFSGIAKLASPSWVDGTAFWHVVQNPLARDGPLRDFVLGMPVWAFPLLTWKALALEVLFLPLALWRWTRPLIWLAMVAMHIGILALVSFADLSAGMLMLHLFTMDSRWLGMARRVRDRWSRSRLDARATGVGASIRT